ncbi:hypothetical protein DL768_010324 [Monosporascus sp. mg162]|nr:hypothetical protein DL768_010324 [Monosporascus sp. mg162]
MASLSALAVVCCETLSSLLGDKVSFPGSPAYKESLASYFSIQAATVLPRCIVFPHTTEDVSIAVSSLTTASVDEPTLEGRGCQFAVRSGGHGTSPGSSNIQDGVTIDLRSLNTIELSEDSSTVSIGVGATWDAVYSSLDTMGLSVAGGRAAGVGVGGLTLGGGISYFSPRYGWTCDTALGFSIVLANGSITEVSANKNEDLRFALRGGSNNFGIVTRVVLKTFEQGPLWSAMLYHPISTIEDQIQEFLSIASANPYDEYASFITTFAYSAPQGLTAVGNNLEAFRRMGVEITLAATETMIRALYRIWNNSLDTVQGIEGLVWGVNLEPLPPAIYARAAETNALGLSDRKGTLIVVLLAVTWSNAADDEIVVEAARGLMAGIEKEARRLNAYDPFVYLNYAGQWQDPIASYGRDSLRRLQEASQEVDPQGVFMFNVPGGFKIPSR